MAVPGSLNEKHLLYAAAAVGSIALLTLADSTLSGNAGVDNRQELGPILDTANEFGNPVYAGPAIACVFAATLLTNNSRLQDAAFTSLESAVYTSLATSALKLSIGRARPRQVVGTQEYNPFSGDQSLPSGHTSLAFAIAVPWAVYYPGPATYALVAAAGGTAVARVSRGDHWTSDVVAGAALGGTIGFLLARNHKRAIDLGEDAPAIVAAPLLAPGSVGLSLSMHF